MKELVEKVAALYADFSKDANAQIENGNKAAGTRARKRADRSCHTCSWSSARRRWNQVNRGCN